MGLKENIKQKRLENKMTLEELAIRVGVSRQTIQRYESGTICNIPSDKIELMASALNTTPANLMGWSTVSDEDIGNVFANDNLFEIIDNISSLSPNEKNHFIKYLQLFETNRKKADNYVEQLLSIQDMENNLMVSAAHGRTDIDITNEMVKHDDDIMNDENF